MKVIETKWFDGDGGRRRSHECVHRMSSKMRPYSYGALSVGYAVGPHRWEDIV